MLPRPQHLIPAFALWACCLPPLCHAQDGAQDTQQLIDGLLARSEAIFSGRFVYRVEAGIEGKPPGGVSEQRVSFSGTSWICRNLRDEGSAGLSHKGQGVEYVRTRQPDGSISNFVRLIQPRHINFKSPSPPVFAGTFWNEYGAEPSTKEFVRSRRGQAVRRPDREVNGIRAAVLEWAVATEQEVYQAFAEFGDVTRNGGLLRLYVAPQLGYVLPRIEHVGVSGIVGMTYDSFDFVEAAPGIFLPQKSQRRNFNGPDGKAGTFLIDYRLRDISQINGKIPDSDFVLEIPDGTTVADARSGKYSVPYKVEKERPFPVPDVEGVLTQERPPFWGRNWQTAVIVGAVVGMVLAAVAFWLLRRSRSRTAPS